MRQLRKEERPGYVQTVATLLLGFPFLVLLDLGTQDPSLESMRGQLLHTAQSEGVSSIRVAIRCLLRGAVLWYSGSLVISRIVP